MRTRLLTSMLATIALSCFAAEAFAQGDPPNPYRATYGWEKMPEGQKLGVSSTAELVRYALEHKLVE